MNKESTSAKDDGGPGEIKTAEQAPPPPGQAETKASLDVFLSLSHSQGFDDQNGYLGAVDPVYIFWF
jgi:hypothetical protein